MLYPAVMVAVQEVCWTELSTLDTPTGLMRTVLLPDVLKPQALLTFPTARVRYEIFWGCLLMSR